MLGLSIEKRDVADTTLTCEEIEELLPQYALGALSAGEAAAVARHLHECVKHVDALDAYEAVCEGLGASVPLVDPPTRLRARLLESVSEQPAARRHDRRGARIGWAAAALAAVLAIVFGVWAFSLQAQMDDRAEQRERLLAIARRPDARMVPLEAAADSTAKGVLVIAGSQAAVWTVALPALEGDQVYECWWIDKDNHWVSGGVFKSDAGAGVWLVSLPDGAENYRAIRITLEPDGGIGERQGPRILVGDF